MKIYEVVWYDEEDRKSINWFSNKAEAEKFARQQGGSSEANVYFHDIKLTKQGVLYFLKIHVQGDW